MEVIRAFAERVENFLVFEMNTGQMIEDVQLALAGVGKVNFYGRPGGVIPTPAELAKVIAYHARKK